jgi:hypothetical protein
LLEEKKEHARRQELALQNQKRIQLAKHQKKSAIIDERESQVASSCDGKKKKKKNAKPFHSLKNQKEHWMATICQKKNKKNGREHPDHQGCFERKELPIISRTKNFTKEGRRNET